MPVPSSPRATNVRSVAVEVFTEWQKTPRFAVDILDDWTRRTALSAPNAAFLHDIVLTSLRNLTLLDHWIDHLTGNKHLDHRTRWLLRIGLCQLLLLGVPSHAAVNETVAIAGRSGALVNAVLRRAGREQAALTAQTASLPLAVQYSHPEFMIRRWIKIMRKAKTEALCQWNQNPPSTYVRVNRLIDAADEKLAKYPGLVPHNEEDFFECDPTPREALKFGLCYAHVPSTAVAPRLLAPRPGEMVLDACAAPGGKTALMAQMMCNEGRIFACDASSARLNRLRENLTPLEPAHENQFVGGRNVKVLPIHFFTLDHKGLAQPLCNGVAGRNNPEALALAHIAPLEIAGGAHKALEDLGEVPRVQHD